MTRPPLQSTADVRLIEQKSLFRGWRKMDRLRVAPRSLKRDGFGEEVEREVVLAGAVSAVLPYVPEADEILMIRLFRIGAFVAQAADPFLYEIPAGFIDAGETPEDCARRETTEETGADILALKKIGLFYPTPGGSDENAHLFVARIAPPSTGIFGLEEEGEEIETHLLPADTVFKMLDNGQIPNGTAAIALHWFARHRDAIRKEWLNT